MTNLSPITRLYSTFTRLISDCSNQNPSLLRRSRFRELCSIVDFDRECDKARSEETGEEVEVETGEYEGGGGATADRKRPIPASGNVSV